jgi:ABC-2 type transport system permease protein
MTTMTVEPVRPTSRPPAPPTLGKRAGSLLASEWIKLRSVRSTYWAVLLSVLAAVVLDVLIARHLVTGWDQLSPAEKASFDPLDAVFNGFGFAQLALTSLGVLVISAEYSSGLIRTTFSAAPRRRAVLAAKAAVFGAVALVVGEVLSFACFWLGQAILSGKHLGISISDPGALRAVLAAGFYLFVAGIIGLGMGAVLRSTAGAVASAIGLLFLLPQVVGALPSPWRFDIGKFLPGNLIAQLTSSDPSSKLLSPGWCWVVLVAYPVAFLVSGAYVISRRDA